MNGGKKLFLSATQEYSMNLRKKKVGLGWMLNTTATSPQDIIN
jgi:hypothetical protein